jgi:hypothetical protein
MKDNLRFRDIKAPRLKDIQPHMQPESFENVKNFLNSSNRKNALQCLSLAIELEENGNSKVKSCLYCMRGIDCLKNGNLSNSIKDLELARTLDSSNPHAVFYLLDAYRILLGNLIKSIAPNDNDFKNKLLEIQELNEKIEKLEPEITDFHSAQRLLSSTKTQLPDAVLASEASSYDDILIDLSSSHFSNKLQMQIYDQDALESTRIQDRLILFTKRMLDLYGVESFIAADHWYDITTRVSKIYRMVGINLPLSRVRKAFDLNKETLSNSFPLGGNMVSLFNVGISSFSDYYCKYFESGGLVTVDALDKPIAFKRFIGAKTPGTRYYLNSSIGANRLVHLASEKTISDTNNNSQLTSCRLLSVGINSYKNTKTFEPLNFAVSDAVKFSNALIPFKYDSKVLVDDQATKNSIVSNLYYESLISHPGDTFIFYFAGHGFADKNGNRFIVPYSQMNDKTVILSLDEISTSLSKHSGKVYIILDTCFNQHKDIDILSSTDIGNTHNSNLTFVFTSSLGQKSFESSSLKSSLYIYSLLDFLASSDIEKGTALSIDTMLTQVSRRTSKLSQALYGLNQNPDFVKN